MKKALQHGDISFHFVDEIPATAKKIEHKINEPYIVAYGEQSGHQHRILGDFEIFEDEKGLYFKVNRPSQVEHWNNNTQQKAEHDTKILQPAIYIRRHEQTFNPFTEELNKVVD